MANKLELTWYGKDEPIRVEPRLLIENTELSNTAADPNTQSKLGLDEIRSMTDELFDALADVIDPRFSR